VEWHRCSPRATDCAFRYTVRACYKSWVQMIPYRAAEVRPLQLPDGKSHHGHACSGAGCWLRSTAQKHCPPSVTVQAVTARCAGRNSQNRGQRACFAAVGWDGASWTRLSHHFTPARARAPPLACNHLAPCLTQQTHAIGLWMAHCCSARVPQNSVVLDRATPAPSAAQ
jgi:hypothetical protein